MKKTLIQLSCLAAFAGMAFAQTIETTVSPVMKAAAAAGAGIVAREEANCSFMPANPDAPQSVIVRHEAGNLVAIVTTVFNGPGGPAHRRPPQHQRFFVRPAMSIATNRIYEDIRTHGKDFLLNFSLVRPGRPGSIHYLARRGDTLAHVTRSVACR